MKEIVKITIVSILLITLHNSCKKDSCEPCHIESTTSDSSFIIGVENEYTRVVTIDPVIIEGDLFTNGVIREYDIDDNGIADFKFESFHFISKGGANYKECSVDCMNSLYQISTIKISDTLHECSQIIDSSTIHYTYYNSYWVFQCNEESFDTVYSVSIRSYPKVYSKGDTLNHLESWSSNKLVLASYDATYMSYDTPNIYEYKVARGNWNWHLMKYILFKKDIGERNLYGWLKIGVESGNQIRFYEYAIQN